VANFTPPPSTLSVRDLHGVIALGAGDDLAAQPRIENAVIPTEAKAEGQAEQSGGTSNFPLVR
jgi:hypothetical protein